MRTFSVYDLFVRNAETHPEHTAIVEAQRRIDHRNLLVNVNWLAAGLAAQGIEKGDRIAVLAHNHYRFLVLFGAAAALGAVVVPINWRLSEAEILHILEDADPGILVTDAEHGAKFKEPVRRARPEILLIHMDASAVKEKCIDDIMSSETVSPAAVEADDPFCIIYTAAMDGKARGAVLSHGNLISANMQIIAAMGLSDADAYLNMLPMFHITGINLALSVMHAGGKNVVVKKFDESETLRMTETEGVTLWGTFPPMLSRLLSAIKDSGPAPAALKYVVGLDGPEPIAELEDRTNAKFWILYGQTETSGFVTFSPASLKPGSAGKATLLSRLRLVDDAEQAVPAGEVGEITVQGPLVFQGFWKKAADNARTFRNGWHHTGDLGMLDKSGYLFFKGRKPEKELIKPGGENVYPAEVEAVILTHPAVTETCVIGVPDPKFGEGIKAVCVLTEGQRLTLEELAEFVAARIARYKKPQYAEFVAELPKTSDGAVDRNQVKSLYGAQAPMDTTGDK